MNLGVVVKMLLTPPELRSKYRFRLGSRPLELRFGGQLVCFGALFMVITCYGFLWTLSLKVAREANVECTLLTSTQIMLFAGKWK